MPAVADEDYVLDSTASQVQITVPESDDAQGVFILGNTSSLTVPELADSNNTVEIVVLRQAGTFETVTVGWSLVRCTDAACGSELTSPPAADDVAPSSGTLTFVEGQNWCSFELTVLADLVLDEDQYFLLALDTPSGTARLADSDTSLVLTVPGNDDQIGFNVTTVTVEEDGGPLVLHIVRTGRGLDDISLQLDIAGEFLLARREANFLLYLPHFDHPPR